MSRNASGADVVLIADAASASEGKHYVVGGSSHGSMRRAYP
jgi:hypothetical protein